MKISWILLIFITLVFFVGCSVQNSGQAISRGERLQHMPFLSAMDNPPEYGGGGGGSPILVPMMKPAEDQTLCNLDTGPNGVCVNVDQNWDQTKIYNYCDDVTNPLRRLGCSAQDCWDQVCKAHIVGCLSRKDAGGNINDCSAVGIDRDCWVSGDPVDTCHNSVGFNIDNYLCRNDYSKTCQNNCGECNNNPNPYPVSSCIYGVAGATCGAGKLLISLGAGPYQTPWAGGNYMVSGGATQLCCEVVGQTLIEASPGETSYLSVSVSDNGQYHVGRPNFGGYSNKGLEISGVKSISCTYEATGTCGSSYGCFFRLNADNNAHIFPCNVPGTSTPLNFPAICCSVLPGSAPQQVPPGGSQAVPKDLEPISTYPAEEEQPLT